MPGGTVRARRCGPGRRFRGNVSARGPGRSGPVPRRGRPGDQLRHRPDAGLHGPLEDTHDTAITPETIIPLWYGERLDLDHAIYVCFANARSAQEKQQQPAGPADRGAARVYKPEECEELVRQYLEHAPRHTAPILVPIQA